MKKLRHIGAVLQIHKLAVLSAFAVSLVVVSPHINAVFDIGWDNFEGIYPTFNDSEIAYQARIQEVREGHLGLGNPYIKERVDDPFVMPPVAEWVYAAVAYSLGVSVPFVTSLMDAVLAFVNFLLVYILLNVVTRSNRSFSLIFTLILFGLSIWTMGRPISIQFNILPMFVGLIYIAKLHFESDGARERRSHILAGLCTGITTFLSPYFFTTMLVLYALLGAGRAYIKKDSIGELKKTLWFGVMYAPFALLYAYFQLRAANYEFYDETVLRYGLMYTHIPGAFTNVAFGVFSVAVVVLAYKLLNKRELIFGLAATLSIVVLNWQNVITGKSLQFASHYMFPVMLMMLIVTAMLFLTLCRPTVRRIRPITRMGVACGVVFLLVLLGYKHHGEFKQIGKVQYSQAELVELQEKAAEFDWLNQNTNFDSVVYTLGGDYQQLLTVYSHNKVFFNPYGSFYLAPNREIEERWMIQNIFHPQISTSTILKHQREIWGNRFVDSYQSAENRKRIFATLTGTPYVKGEMVSAAVVNDVYESWRELSAFPLPELFRRYEVDYILLSEEYQYFDEARTRIVNELPVELPVDLDGTLVYRLLD